jgi:hypothetical protein
LVVHVDSNALGNTVHGYIPPSDVFCSAHKLALALEVTSRGRAPELYIPAHGEKTQAWQVMRVATTAAVTLRQRCDLPSFSVVEEQDGNVET